MSVSYLLASTQLLSDPHLALEVMAPGRKRLSQEPRTKAVNEDLVAGVCITTDKRKSLALCQPVVVLARF